MDLLTGSSFYFPIIHSLRRSISVSEAELRINSTSSATSDLTSKMYRRCNVRIVIGPGGNTYKPKDIKEIPNLYGIEMQHFDDNWRTWFKAHEFPNIESLSIRCSLYAHAKIPGHWDSFTKHKSVVAENLSTIFSGMKTLKYLTMLCEVPFDTVKADFTLESAEAYCILPFIESSASTLKRLKVFLLKGFSGYKLKSQDLLDFYSKYVQLESLSCVIYLSKDDLQKQLPSSETLKHLDIHIIDKDNNER